MILWAVLLTAPRFVDPVADAEAKVSARVQEKTFSARRSALFHRYDQLLFPTEKDKALEELFLRAQLRSFQPGPGPADVTLVLGPDTQDKRLLKAAFVAYGDRWPRAAQTEVVRRLGGDAAPEDVRVWYAMFPLLYGADPGDLPALGAIAAQFPNSFVPPFMRYETVRDMYDSRIVGLKTYAVTEATHQQALGDLDRVYAITNRLFGKDRPWHLEFKNELNEMRRKALARPLRLKSARP